MPIEVELFGQYATGRPRRTTLRSEARITVREAGRLLGLQPEELGLVSIDGRQSELDDVVPQDCRLCFFPPMTGG